MHWSEVWTGERPGARLARACLAPLSWIYALGWTSYAGVYRLGLKRPREPHRPVVCVGALQAGGSGKTPVALAVARLLMRSGRRVILSAPGYGAPAAEGARLAPEGPLCASKWGDEPALLRWLEPALPLVVGRRRVLAAELAHRADPGAVLVLDDGYQHLPLRRHVNILLDPADPPNARCLPAGPYRQPRRARVHADLALPGGGFRVVEAPLRLVTPLGEERAPAVYSALCAIARPERFFAALAAALAPPSPTIALPDHDPMTAGNLFERLPRDRPIVVTAKDWMKLRDRADVAEREFLIATHEVRIEPEDAFLDWLLTRLNG